MTHRNKTRALIGALALATLAIGAATCYYLLGQPDGTADTTVKKDRKVLYWHDPMVPGYKSDKPGKSPFMDMDLVPVYEGEGEGEGEGAAGTVAIRPEVVNNLGIRTHVVAPGQWRQELRAEGYLLREGGSLLVALDIFDREASWVRTGLPARVRVYAAPGREYEALVHSVQPDIDVGVRTVRTRLRLLAPDAQLKPNFAAQAAIYAPPARDVIAVPREALIRTGTRTAVVLALEGGRFRPVDVLAGRESGESVEIVKGLRAGERVVTSGQFLIDSEASVRASFERMDAAAHDHSSHAPAPAAAADTPGARTGPGAAKAPVTAPAHDHGSHAGHKP
jgi:hypothetical protein